MRDNPRMPEPTSKQIVAVIEKLESFLNESNYIPATNFHRSKVLLALLSKVLTTGRAVCTLVDAGFDSEAFGLSRTMLEIYLTIRYIANADTEARAKEYVEYVAKTQEYLQLVVAKHLPQIVLPALAPHFVEMANKYSSPHRWYQGHGGHVRAMAMEPDTYEKDADGNPTTEALDYEHVYSQTSHHVHATIISLLGHGLDAGEHFRVRANMSNESHWGGLALFNVLVYVSKSFVSGFRGLRDDQPEELLQEVHAMTSAFAKATRPVDD